MLDFFHRISKHGDIILAIMIVMILLVLIFPIPTGLLDVLLAFSISTGIVILMNTLFIKRPLELSSFPTLLLITTTIRLALNIASSRLILSYGHTGTAAAGHVIEAFGNFVMQQNVIIGIIVFMILTIINFIVITKGSSRIAEVVARFSLDSMPGKQMAIDADLSAGMIDENTAKLKRAELEEESTFFGSMDGANKFVRGDAIAGIIIIFINLVGGIIIGVLQRGLSFDTAVHTYTMLTIGDGLVAQIPSLVISLAAGLLVTKSGTTGSTDKVIFGQLGKYPQALMMSACVTGLMALLPGLPFIPFAILGSILAFFSYATKNLAERALMNEQQGNQTEIDQDAATPLSHLAIDPITLELGYYLIPLVSGPSARLMDDIKSLRNQMVKDYGFILPSVRIKDGDNIDDNEYIIKIKEIEAARGTLYLDKLLTINPTGQNIELEGIKAINSPFGTECKWINHSKKEQINNMNYTALEPEIVLVTHLTEVIRENIDQILSYSEVQKLIDNLSETHKKLVKDFIPDIVSVSTIHKVLEKLLLEGVSIRDLATIIEAIGEVAKSGSDTTLITEHVREKLSRQISYLNLYQKSYIPIIAISAEWEQNFLNGIGNNNEFIMPPSKIQEFTKRLQIILDEQILKGFIPVIVTSPKIRPYVYSLIQRFNKAIKVLSHNEIHESIKVRKLDTL